MSLGIMVIPTMDEENFRGQRDKATLLKVRQLELDNRVEDQNSLIVFCVVFSIKYSSK